MLSYKSFVTFLIENRIDFLKKNNPTIDSSHDHLALHRDPSAIIDHFADNADPTQNKAHTNWILNRYKNKEIRQEDAPRIKDALTKFEQNKSRLPEKDINKYPSLPHLENAVAQFDSPAKSARQEKKEIKQEGADVVHSGNGVNIFHLKTPEAARYYAAGTKWCTSDASMFNQYNKMGPILMINHKGRKYQFHNESNQFMDEQDRPVSLDHLHPDIQDELFKSTHPEMKKLIVNKGNSGHMKRLIDEGNLNEKDHRDIIDKVALNADQPTREHLRKRFSFSPEMREKLNEHDIFDDVLNGKTKLPKDEDRERDNHFEDFVNDVNERGNVHHVSKLLHMHGNGWSIDKRTIKNLGERIIDDGSHEHISKLLDRPDLLRHISDPNSYTSIGHDMFYKGNEEIRNKLMERPEIFDYTVNRHNQNAIAHIGSEAQVKKLLDNSAYLDYKAATHLTKRNLPGVNARFADDKDLVEKISGKEDMYGYSEGGRKEFYGHLINNSDHDVHNKLIQNPDHLDEMGPDNRNELMTRANKPNRDLFLDKIKETSFTNKDVYEPNKLRTTASYSDALESPNISEMDADGIITKNHPEHVRQLIDKHFDSLNDEQKIRLHDNTNPHGEFGTPEHAKNHDEIAKKITGQKNISDEVKDQLVDSGNPSHLEKLTRNHALSDEQHRRMMISMPIFQSKRRSEGEDEEGVEYSKLHNKIVQNVLNKGNYSEGFITRALKNGNAETAFKISKLPPEKLTHEHKLRMAANSRDRDGPFDGKAVDNLLNGGHDLDSATKEEIARSGTGAQRTKLLDMPTSDKNVPHEMYRTLAKFGTDEHRSKILKIPNIDNMTKAAIAANGTDEHRDELLKDPNLHSEVQTTIAKSGHSGHRAKLMSDYNISPETETAIASTASSLGSPREHIQLLKRPKLSDNTKEIIARGSASTTHRSMAEGMRVNLNRTELLKNHPLSHRALSIIAADGTDEHRSAILDILNKNRNLDSSKDNILTHIAAGGVNPSRTGSNLNLANENRTKLIENHGKDLSPDATAAIAREGTDEHRKSLLENIPNFHEHVKTHVNIGLGGRDHSQSALAHENRSKLLEADGKKLVLSYNAKKAIAEHGTDEHREILSRPGSGISSSSVSQAKTDGEMQRRS